jgi:hypothetical protein
MTEIVFFNRLSNEGARHQFEYFLEEFIFPVLVQCAQVTII